jgi:hypothetical protein
MRVSPKGYVPTHLEVFSQQGGKGIYGRFTSYNRLIAKDLRLMVTVNAPVIFHPPAMACERTPSFHHIGI